MSNKIQIRKTNYISITVFIISLCVAVITISSLIFPALIVTITSGSENQVNSFELGAWTVPFFIVNFLIFVIGIFYYKKKIPNKIQGYIKFILNFEISQKVTIIVIIVLLGLYVAYSIPELGQNEIDVWRDWKFIEPLIVNFPNGEGSIQLKALYVKNFLLFSSLTIFQNVKVLPFVASFSLIIITYFFTVKISQKRFAGLIAMVILLQSHTFLRYDTTATFSNFWTLFYVLSLYLIYKKWYLSPFVFLASIFSKPLTVVFLPLTLFFILRLKIPQKNKIILTLFYLIIIGVLIIALFTISKSPYIQTMNNFDSIEFWSGFTAWAFQLRIDGIVLVFLLPLIVGLFLKSRQGKHELQSIIVLITGILFAAPLLAGFTDFNLQPYRWIPLIVFFAIGVGTLLSKSSSNNIKSELT